MLTTAQLIEWRALTAGPDGAAASTSILAERGMLLALLDEVLAGREGWRPIETAPRDGTNVLLWMTAYGGRSRIGHFDDDRYSKKPRPFWRSLLDDITTCRRGQPPCWQPLPEPPEQENPHD